MSIVFDLDHVIDTTHHAGWLWYSHDGLNPPTDRQIVSGFGIVKPAGIRLAHWYFLSNQALQVLNGTNYFLMSSHYPEWRLRIDDPGRAALFKLRFM